MAKNLPANAGDIRDGIRSLGWDDPLEEGIPTHSSILARRIPWMEETGRLHSIRSKRVGHAERLSMQARKVETWCTTLHL